MKLLRCTLLVSLLALVVAGCAPGTPEKVVETVVVKETVEVPSDNLRVVRFTHGGSMCNMALFVSFQHLDWWAEEGLVPASVIVPSMAENISAVQAGVADFTGAPYTSHIAGVAWSDGSVKVISGIGTGGLGIIAQEGLDTPEELKGTKWGFPSTDTLEVLAWRWLQKNGMGYEDIEMIYEAAGMDVLAAWQGGTIDVSWCCAPYCEQFVQEYNAVRLSDGTDIFGEHYSDCLLSTSAETIKNDPELIKSVIKILMRAQQLIEQDPQAAIDLTFGSWYKVKDKQFMVNAMKEVAPMIDQRSQVEFIMGGVDFMQEFGYIPADLAAALDSPDKIFYWSFLEQVIEENPELYNSLQNK